MRAILTAVILVAAACDAPPTSAELEAILSERLATPHFIYHFAPGDSVDTVRQERWVEVIGDTLGILPSEPMHFYKYRDAEQIGQLVGRVTNGIADPELNRFHSIWPFDDHEPMHVLVTRHLGNNAPALFSEGIAVAHQFGLNEDIVDPYWNARRVHEVAVGVIRSGTLPPLDALIETASFFDEYDDQITYPVAGSFIRFVMDSTGSEPILDLMRQVPRFANADVTATAFEATFRATIEMWWMRWQEYLRANW